MSWTLILLVYAGALSKGDSVALTHVNGFKTEQLCVAAGEAAKKMTVVTYKETKFVCVRQE